MFDRKAYRRAQYAANRETELASSRRGYMANKEKVCERTKRWQKANPEKAAASSRKYLAANRQVLRERTRLWRLANPAHKTLLVAQRRALKKAAKCACCAPISFKFIYLQARSLKMEVDHVQPLSKGGKHCLRNLQLLEPHDNRTKHARWAA